LAANAGGPKTVADRTSQYGHAARARLKPFFKQAKLAYPPQRLALLAFKQERIVEVCAADANGDYRRIRSYPILGASGELGPKLREGDRQVPEGIYPVESLNPNSRFHLSLRIGYPNAFDRARATEEKRTHLGGDIMIHGGAASIGCLAMGDQTAEDLFVLAADTGLKRITVVISPVDFRAGKEPPRGDSLPSWTDELYESIRSKLKEFPRDTADVQKLRGPDLAR
jgi:murein L,D-transpeptidase YafK